MNKIEQARELAAIAHKNQMYGDVPYIKHLDDVAELVKEYGEDAQVLAYLHDVYEDTKHPLLNIQKMFGEYMKDCVVLISDYDGKNRKERKLKTNLKFNNISNSYKVVLIVKVADRLSNVLNCIKKHNKGLLEMYKKEHLEFKKAVYRVGVCDRMWETLDYMIRK